MKPERRTRAVAVLLSVVLAAPGPPAPPGPTRLMVEPIASDCNGEEVERTVWLMGTSLRGVVCAGSRTEATAALESAFARVGDVEDRLSSWRSDSELSRLNGAPPGAWIRLSSATADVLAEVHRWSRRTGGAFDPAVGAAIDAWDLQGSGRVPAPEEVEEARRTAGPEGWQVDAPGRRARRAAGVRLDAGAFGKGAALRDGVAALRHAGVRRAVLDFGGQLVLWSADPSERWTVTVAHPHERDRAVVSLRVGSGSVATTGLSERTVSTPDGPAGHVIDPRVARPVPPWGSVTVVAADPLRADVLSTALFVMRRPGALDWGREAPDVGVLILQPVDGGLESYRSDGLGAVASVEMIESGTTTPRGG